MGVIHDLLLRHGKDEAKSLLPGVERYLIDLASQMLGEEVNQPNYLYTGFAMTHLPHRRTKNETEAWERHNGKFMLMVEPGRLIGRDGQPIRSTDGKPKIIGVPYGPRARLILIYLQSEALKTSSPIVRLGASLHDWMDRMGMAGGGTCYTAIREQSERISACRLTVAWRSDEGNAGFERANIVSAMMFSPPTDSRQGSLWEETARLSPEFYSALGEHPMPVSEIAIKAIKNSSVTMDVYVWLCYRLRSLTKSTTVSWEALHNQFGSSVKELKRFKNSFVVPLKEALAVYPDAKVDIVQSGLILRPSRSAIPETESRRRRIL